MGYKDESAGTLLAGGITVLLGTLVGLIARGLVLVKLWLWFVATPLGLPPISAATALGLGMTVFYLSGATALAKTDSKIEDDEELGSIVIKTLIVGIGTPLFVLLMGWIIHQFQ